MPKTSPSKRRLASRNIDAQFALAERALRNINTHIDEQIERARDLEVQHALVLYKAGKAEVHEAEDVFREARARIK